MLTTTNVPGKKSMPRNAMVFIEELSFLVSIATVFITSLSALLALAMMAEPVARPRWTFTSLCAVS